MIRKVGLALVASTAAVSATAHAATDYYLRVAGIDGDVTAVGFEKSIQLESWSMGYVRGACQALHFVKQTSVASPDLTSATLLGTFYPTITLYARRTGGDGQAFTYLKLTLSNSVFTSFQTGGSAGSGVLPMEQISVQPSAVVVEAFRQDPVGGGVALVATTNVTCQKPK